MDPRLKVVLEVVDKVSKTIANIDRQVRTNLRRLQLTLLAVGATVASFVTLAIKAATNQAMAFARLDSAMGGLPGGVETTIEALSKLSGFTSTELANALLGLKVSLGDNELALKALPAAAAIARAGNMDLQAAVTLLAAALGGDVGAIKQLHGLGVTLEDLENPMAIITAILRKLNPEMENLVPHTSRLNVAWNTLLTTLGAGAATEGLVKALTAFLNVVNAIVSAHPALLAAIQAAIIAVGALALAISALIGWFLLSGPIMAAVGVIIGLLTGPIGLVLLAIVGLLVIGWIFHKEWIQIWADSEKNLFEKIAAMIVSVVRFLGFILPGSPFSLIGAILRLETEWKRVWESLPDVTWQAILAMLSPIGQLINAVSRAISLLERLNILQSSSSVGSSGVTRGFQHGGIMPVTGWARVGEAGPETVLLPGGSRVIPNGSGTGGVTVIFQGPVYGLADLDERVILAVRRALTGGGFGGLING